MHRGKVWELKEYVKPSLMFFDLGDRATAPLVFSVTLLAGMFGFFMPSPFPDGYGEALDAFELIKAAPNVARWFYVSFAVAAVKQVFAAMYAYSYMGRKAGGAVPLGKALKDCLLTRRLPFVLAFYLILNLPLLAFTAILLSPDFLVDAAVGAGGADFLLFLMAMVAAMALFVYLLALLFFAPILVTHGSRGMRDAWKDGAYLTGGLKLRILWMMLAYFLMEAVASMIATAFLGAAPFPVYYGVAAFVSTVFALARVRLSCLVYLDLTDGQAAAGG
ncbi:MAG: hypothetical protein FWE70_07635 [Oscillospiraceae bacterium]|nr:hypothetical protein [Oscillospiraceae bacterium]